MEQMDQEEDKTQSLFGFSKGPMVSHYRIIEQVGRGGMGVAS